MWNTVVHPANTLHHVFGWLMNEIVQDAPEEIAICEFDCRKQCSSAEWTSCERRLKKAAGELMPPASAPYPHERRSA
jgi:hypothetical protein